MIDQLHLRGTPPQRIYPPVQRVVTKHIVGHLVDVSKLRSLFRVMLYFCACLVRPPFAQDGLALCEDGQPVGPHCIEPWLWRHSSVPPETAKCRHWVGCCGSALCVRVVGVLFWSDCSSFWRLHGHPLLHPRHRSGVPTQQTYSTMVSPPNSPPLPPKPAFMEPPTPPMALASTCRRKGSLFCPAPYIAPAPKLAVQGSSPFAPPPRQVMLRTGLPGGGAVPSPNPCNGDWECHAFYSHCPPGATGMGQGCIGTRRGPGRCVREGHQGGWKRLEKLFGAVTISSTCR